MNNIMGAKILIPQCFYDSQVLVPQWIGNEDFENCSIEEGVITYSRSEVIDGKFEELESKLKGLKIPFERYSDGFNETPPEKRIYRPSEKDEEKDVDISMYTSDGNEPFIEFASLRNILNGTNSEDAICKINEMLNKYDPEVKSLSDYNN